MDDEVWKTITDFPIYEISNYGRIHSLLRDMIMKPSKTREGHLKISLYSEWDNSRFTRSVALLVAREFVEIETTHITDYHRPTSVIHKDGKFENVHASNLAWRPPWFVWKYTRQMRTIQPSRYYEVPVIEVGSGIRYDSIVEAGVELGMLFQDIWLSCLNGVPYIPNKYVFEIDRKRLEHKGV